MLEANNCLVADERGGWIKQAAQKGDLGTVCGRRVGGSVGFSPVAHRFAAFERGMSLLSWVL